jgi:hypothetical protein
MRKLILATVALAGLVGLGAPLASAQPYDHGRVEAPRDYRAASHSGYYWNHHTWHHRHWDHGHWRYYN